MQRRGVLTTLLAGAAGLTGCSGLLDQPGQRTDTLTPAPVGTAVRRAVEPDTPEPCPELPAHAEVYVCSGTKDAGLRFRPSTSPEPGRRTLELQNGTTLPFNTGPDWWTLARLFPDTGNWVIADQGVGTSSLRLAPGASFRWVLTPAETPADTTESRSDTGAPDDTESPGATDSRSVRMSARPPPGRYAFSVVGNFRGGELTAVITQFTVGK